MDRVRWELNDAIEVMHLDSHTGVTAGLGETCGGNETIPHLRDRAVEPVKKAGTTTVSLT